MKLLYIGTFPPKKIIEKSAGKIDSLYRIDEAIITGLRSLQNIDIEVITAPDIASFPVNRIFYRSFYDEKDQAFMPSILNFPVIKQFWTILSIFIASSKIVRKSKETCHVIIPYMVTRHTSVCRMLQLFYGKKVRVAIIVPDVFFSKSFLSNTYYKIAEKHAKHFDHYILYTEAMAKYLGIQNKPYTVMEGFCRVQNRPIKTDKSKFVITYAGSLNIAYGIKRLLDAMYELTDLPLELRLYGAGDGVVLIKERAAKDERIKFYGIVSKEEAINVLYEANLLINPRNATDGEYVEYSFPSKDIDYLSTGIPSILCKLPGMPKSYYGHFVDAGDGSARNIADAIRRAYTMDSQELAKIAAGAKSFITERMDNKNQARRIVELLNS